MQRSQVVIIHLEGNISSNPNLTGIVELLVAEGRQVEIYSLRKPGTSQQVPCDGARLVLIDQMDHDGMILSQPQIAQLMGKTAMVVGVDRGVIEACKISRELGVPYGLISYEILFADEVGISHKNAEIEACKGISFAIVPDKLRGKKLAQENKISKDLFFYVPVAGSGIYSPAPGNRPRIFHRHFPIPDAAHVALYMGSVNNSWAMTHVLLSSVSNWPANWHLVIHGRDGLDQRSMEVVTYYAKALDRIHVSVNAFAKIQDMREFIWSADLGVAFYQPFPGHVFTQKNIACMGMSSGKIATYLQHGLPVAVNRIGEMSDWVRSKRLGQVVDLPERFVPDDAVLGTGQRCQAFFSEKLDLSRTLRRWLRYVAGLR